MNFIRYIQQNRVQKIMAFAVFCFWIGLFYYKIDTVHKLSHRPGGEHAWAQTDRASVALTYYSDSASFWLPRCHQIDGNDEGITAGEFPLIPYTVSKMYAAWGFREIYHRALVLSITLTGFLFSFLLALRFVRRPFWAAVVAVLWIASPNLIYYSLSFLPDSSALAFLTIALFFLCKDDTPARTGDLFFFSLFSALAILLKASALLPLGAVLSAFFITKWNSRLQGTKNKVRLVIAFLIPLLPAFAWIKYARHVVETYHIFTFLMEPMPPRSWADWQKGMAEFANFSNQYYINGFWYFLAAATLIGLIFLRRSDRFLFLSALFIYIGGYFLFVLMIQRAPAHFYYWVPFQLGLFFHLAWLADLLVKSKWPAWGHVFLGTGALVFINYNAIHIQKNVNRRWVEGSDYFGKYYDLEPTLDKLGIRYGDRVFSYKDETFNNSLYLMNRKGITESVAEDPERLNRLIQLCDYAVLSDTTLFVNPLLRANFGEQLGEHRGLYIYRLQKRP